MDFSSQTAGHLPGRFAFRRNHCGSGRFAAAVPFTSLYHEEKAT
jgi:hypothetical protein